VVFRIHDSYSFHGLGLRVWGSAFRVWGLGCTFQNLGFGV
jgi:hypothetical protein